MSDESDNWSSKVQAFLLLTIKTHAFAIVIAFIVGAYAIAPHVLATASIGDAYNGIPFIFQDDETVYLARIQEVLDGHVSIASPYFFEYKHFPTVYPVVGELFYSIPAAFLKIPVSTILIGTKFAYPFVLTLLIYALVLQYILPRNAPYRRLTAAAAGIIAIIGHDFIDAQTFSLWLQGVRETSGPSTWTRPVNPITGGIFLFVYFTLLTVEMRRHRRLLPLVLGIMLGLMSFYFFSWGLTLAITFFISLLTALRKDWKGVKYLSWIIGIGVLVSAVLLRHAIAGLWSTGVSSASRLGMFYTHDVIINKAIAVSVVVFIILTYVMWCRKNKNWKSLLAEDWWLFSAAVLLGGFAVFNQQVLTGRTIWPDHFVQYTKPMSMVVLIIAGYHVIASSYPRIWKYGMSAVIIFVIFYASLMASGYQARLDDYRNLQKDADLFAWLNTNAERDCVVYVAEERTNISFSIPAFTHCNVYHAPWYFSGVDQERILHNFHMILRTEGVTEETFDQYLREHELLAQSYFFSDWDEMMDKSGDAWIESIIEQYGPGYFEFLKNDIAAELHTYRVDYLYVANDWQGDVQVFPDVQIIQEIGDGVLYSINR